MVCIDPSVLFEHEGWSGGPAFKGIYSGSSIQTTGPLASWLMKKASKTECQKIEGRKTQPVNVTIAQLPSPSHPFSSAWSHVLYAAATANGMRSQ
ncbi:hypothetical protein PISMIDRAFT_677380 [Pisolithus microcarpus 441]|uniref:Uncharacterized protein n=1 Tax=Pisolithus microcarpus 441 TaxID=765257 RepID=A0A0C9YJM5_9AGAM|nr:hypothetical protein PISMIDRAFT_677380 [Pisolithus microcarpus 441]